MVTHDLEGVIQDLVDTGLSVRDALLPEDMIAGLYKAAHSRWEANEFHDARVGHASQPQRMRSIRGDAIRWLDPAACMPAEQRFLDWTETLRLTLNRELFLGLNRGEFHYARYGAGDGYSRHMDQHRGQMTRRITLILYLTPDRRVDDGGELCLYHPDRPDDEWGRVAPERGRLVLFRSEQWPHAVLPSMAPRWSVTGWLRNDQAL